MTNFTKIYNEFKPQIEKLNKQFKKLQKHTKELTYTDLKLHDVAFYVGDDEKLLNYFETFCEFEYEYFEDWVYENHLRMEQLGHTSSFYFYGKEDSYEIDIYDMKKDETIFDTLGYGLETEIETLFNSDNFYQAYYNLENDCHIDLSDGDDLEELESVLDDSIEELEDYLRVYYREMRNIRKMYKWLEDYKANQVEYFKDYVENNDF